MTKEPSVEWKLGDFFRRQGGFLVLLVLVILGVAAFALYRSGFFGGNEEKAAGPGKADEESQKGAPPGGSCTP